jgi:beta-lysine 5,6-aminomutase alpha subunit
MESIEKAMFADISRSRTGGKGFEGIVEKGEGYFNPVESILERSLGLA